MRRLGLEGVLEASPSRSRLGPPKTPGKRKDVENGSGRGGPDGTQPSRRWAAVSPVVDASYFPRVARAAGFRHSMRGRALSSI